MNFFKIILSFMLTLNVIAMDVELIARANSYGSYNMPDVSYVLNSTIVNNGHDTVSFSFTNVQDDTVRMGLWLKNSHYPEGTTLHFSNEGNYIGTPSINEKGDVVFTVYNENEVIGLYLYIHKKNSLSKVIDQKQAVIYQSLRDPKINNSGTILFRAIFKSGEKVILTLNKGQFTTIATDKEVGIAYLFGASFYDSDHVALKVREGDNLLESQPDTIRVYNKKAEFSRLNFDKDFDSNSSFIHINNTIGSSHTSKYIAFVAKLDSGKSVLVRQLGDHFEIIAKEGEGGISKLEYFAPSLNEKGNIAFRAINASKKRGIFYFDGFIVREVLSEGDLVATDQSTAVIYSSNGPAFGGGLTINNSNEIVLQAKIYTKYKEQSLGTAIVKLNP